MSSYKDEKIEIFAGCNESRAVILLITLIYKRELMKAKIALEKLK